MTAIRCDGANNEQIPVPASELNDLRLEIKLHGKEAKNRNVFAGIGNLDMVPESQQGPV